MQAEIIGSIDVTVGADCEMGRLAQIDQGAGANAFTAENLADIAAAAVTQDAIKCEHGALPLARRLANSSRESFQARTNLEITEATDKKAALAESVLTRRVRSGVVLKGQLDLDRVRLVSKLDVANLFTDGIRLAGASGVTGLNAEFGGLNFYSDGYLSLPLGW